MISRRNLIWAIPFTIFLTFPLWRIPVAGFLNPRGGYDPTLDNRKLDTHNFSLDQIHISQSENGRKTLEIVAKNAYTGDKKDVFKLDEVDAVVISKSGEQTFITARHGILDKNTSILTLIDEVVVMKPKDKFELYSDLLTYNQQTHIAHSPGRTQILGEKIDIVGHSLLFNSLTNAYDLSGRIRCKLSNFSTPEKFSSE
jgi:LPS export ABC transporter protein LptC